MHAALRDRGWLMKHMKIKRLMHDQPFIPRASAALSSCPRICPHLALPGLRPHGAESGARTGGVPMDLEKAERAKRTDSAPGFGRRTDPAFSAQWEFLKNNIQIND